MGTGRSGAFYDTAGGRTKASHFALIHSTEGKFNKPSKPKDRLRLVSGGHGQSGMDLLDKYGIKYVVVHTYKNGVRIGHVPDHKSPKKQSGTSQSWFPKSWSNQSIEQAGEHVAKLKKNQGTRDGVTMFGQYRGVRVGVILTNGIIGTIFPDSNQKKRRS